MQGKITFHDFTISRLPRIRFGAGCIDELPALVKQYGQRLLLVTGAHSFRDSPAWGRLISALQQHGIHWQHTPVSGEPSPTLVDETVQQHYGSGICVVAGIGGGSVLDAAKAIAGLLPHGNSVLDHLEGVGKGINYRGPALPFIAVPTTAGTGSEATKNAVLSHQGPDGYKKSFRHECLVPEYAIIDPQLLASCPAPLVAADGMDAFTQLLESYVSLKANPFTDALAWSGLSAVRQGFFDAWRGAEPAAGEGRAAMAYAALLSGITLAQVGLGSVHGLASPLGAFFPIPHGVVCGTLVAAATAVNIEALQQRAPADHPALRKYARVGRLLGDCPHASETEAHRALLTTLTQWSEQLALPRLSACGVTAQDLDRIVTNSRGSSMTTNPLILTDDEIRTILQQRL